MSWVAEILRKQHRVCKVCRLGPTHLYDPGADPAAEAAEAADALEPDSPEAGARGTPLCNACLEPALARDLSRYAGRCLVFEPALGPETLRFHALEGAGSLEWPADHLATARSCLDGLDPLCRDCAAPGRFRWIPVDQDANLWAGDWLSSLHEGALTAGDTLCGACAARRLVRSFDERGLCFEAIVPPRGGDGVLFCGESY